MRNPAISVRLDLAPKAMVIVGRDLWACAQAKLVSVSLTSPCASLKKIACNPWARA